MSFLPSDSDRPRRGMVLLELMVALFVFTLVAFSLVMALDAGMEAGRDRNEIQEAVDGIDNQLTLLHSGPLVSCDRDLPADSSGISYHITIEPAQMLDQKHQPVAGMLRATLTAKWKSDGHAEDRSVSELIYQP